MRLITVGESALILAFFVAMRVTGFSQTVATDIEKCIADLARGNSETRQKAALALQSYGVKAKAAVPALIENLNQRDKNVRICCINALGEIGTLNAQQVATLAKGLKDEVPLVRGVTADVLGRLRASKAEGELKASLGDADASVRIKAAVALTRINPKLSDPCFQVLVKIMEVDDISLQCAVVAATVEVGESIQSEMLKSLKSKNANIRKNIANAFAVMAQNGTVKDKSVILSLANCLGDNQAIVRECIAHAMGGIGPGAKEVLPALHKLTNDEERRVREAAHAAIRSITNKEY